MEFEIMLSRKVEQLATIHIKAATVEEAKDKALRLANSDFCTWEFWGVIAKKPRIVECSQIS